MGLDLVITLKNKNDENLDQSSIDFLSNNTLADQNNVDTVLNGTAVYSKYYRLNWSGVRAEDNFMKSTLPILSMSKAEFLPAKRTLKQVKKNKWYFVIGYGRDFFYKKEYKVQSVFKGSQIHKGKGNVIRLGGKLGKRFFQNDYINRYEIYEYDAFPISSLQLGSAISMITVGRWEGSNGESYSLQHTPEGLIIYQIKCDYDDELDEEVNHRLEEVLKLDEETADELMEVAKDCIGALTKFLETNPEHYIAKNNLTAYLMMYEFLNNTELELVSYYG